MINLLSLSREEVSFKGNCPNPLLTPNDIDGSKILFNKSTGCRLLRMQQRFIIKFCLYNMLYVAKSTTVPVPKVYAHPGYFSNVEGGPLLDDMFSAIQGAYDIKTSFVTEDELIDYIIRTYSLETGERMAYKTRYYQHVLPTVHRGDGSPNVIVQPDRTPVEYSTAIYANSGWNDDWHEYVRMALDEYPNQSLWLSTMKREMWT
ncbi:hypothetical protein QBC46DRAFT_421108 [Diplogelasinospora grovesii]|uniref:Uncharacterized protein n=1 Tax=Diplogelasinospora grovesii TaxID=303347 RepID=A0AAN6MYG1_9PEZI|nr:hypothetical protein QBC46DRAFT_421108 [Diplogelasinospora grovesii]